MIASKGQRDIGCHIWEKASLVRTVGNQRNFWELLRRTKLTPLKCMLDDEGMKCARTHNTRGSKNDAPCNQFAYGIKKLIG